MLKLAAAAESSAHDGDVLMIDGRRAGLRVAALLAQRERDRRPRLDIGNGQPC
jgi:hypothetical protein